jgi:hypothetical protein
MMLYNAVRPHTASAKPTASHPTAPNPVPWFDRVGEVFWPEVETDVLTPIVEPREDIVGLKAKT